MCDVEGPMDALELLVNKILWMNGHRVCSARRWYGLAGGLAPCDLLLVTFL